MENTYSHKHYNIDRPIALCRWETDASILDADHHIKCSPGFMMKKFLKVVPLG